MSTLSNVFKAGFGLLVVGFLLSFVSQPVGLGLAQLGVAIIGSIVFVSILGVILAVLAVAGGSDSNGRERKAQSRVQQRSAAQQRARREQGQQPDRPMQRDQPDLDVSTIEDYRR